MERRHFLARLAGAVAAAFVAPRALQADRLEDMPLGLIDVCSSTTIRPTGWLCIGGPLDGYYVDESAILPSGRTNMVAYRLWDEEFPVRYAWYRMLKHENRAGFYLGYEGPAWGPLTHPAPFVTLPA